MFGWLRKRRRRKILQQAWPDQWEQILRDNVLHSRFLNDQDRQKLRQRVQIFVAEKNWEGCRGLIITDEIKVTIAGLACLLALHLQPAVYFDNVLSILVYPRSYVAKDVQTTRAGVVIEGGEPRLGEAWWRGPVILSWKDTLAAGQRRFRGRNLVFHEFAHQLDMLNGRFVDGIPPLQTREELQRWVGVMSDAYQQHVANCRQRRFGVIDCYGATNPAEFFAVTTEAFFENSAALQTHHPNIYDVLCAYYGHNPASWPTDQHSTAACG